MPNTKRRKKLHQQYIALKHYKKYLLYLCDAGDKIKILSDKLRSGEVAKETIYAFCKSTKINYYYIPHYLSITNITLNCISGIIYSKSSEFKDVPTEYNTTNSKSKDNKYELSFSKEYIEHKGILRMIERNVFPYRDLLLYISSFIFNEIKTEKEYVDFGFLFKDF